MLTAAPWYADGLSPAEAAFIVTLQRIGRWYPDLFQSLVDDFHSQSTTVTLPLAGEVTIWVFQNTPFPPDEPLLERVADAAKAAESFLQKPFPTDQVILLVTDPSEPGFWTGGWHFGSYMLLPRHDGEVPGVAHETAHYFFRLGPFWLSEGAANLLEYHIMALEDPVARRAMVEGAADTCLADSELENIRHGHLRNREGQAAGLSNCDYYIGERFLLRIADAVGMEALAGALADLYAGADRLSGERGEDEREAFIHRTFLAHAPEGTKEAFDAVYREFHGGFEGFDPQEADDHGNDRGGSTRLGVGERIEGFLDYSFDNDFFAVALERDRKYEVIFEQSVNTTSLALLTGAGELLLRFESGARLTDRVAAVPASGTYYFAVQNFGGDAAPYSLLVREIPSVEDDHGDFLSSATEIAVGETLTGTLHDETDFDVFRVSLQRYGYYKFEIIPPMGKVIRTWLYDENGLSPEMWVGNSFSAAEEGYGDFFRFVTFDGGLHYLVVDGARENNLAYSVTITDISEGPTE
ncbi:MAG: hypothetical protein F4Y92_05380 [Dehalococcoidia bacterium]|nr:hypothetical protein [Dehalococcoidia bacterium]